MLQEIKQVPTLSTEFADTCSAQAMNTHTELGSGSGLTRLIEVNWG